MYFCGLWLILIESSLTVYFVIQYMTFFQKLIRKIEIRRNFWTSQGQRQKRKKAKKAICVMKRKQSQFIVYFMKLRGVKTL